MAKGKGKGKGTKQGEDGGDEGQEEVAAPPAAGSSHADDSDEDGDEGQGSGPETRSQMLKRHKGEMTAHKKALQRMGKKSKEELAKLTKEIEDRHVSELAALEARDKAAPAAPPQQQQEGLADERPEAATTAAAAAATGLEDLSLTADSSKKPSKAQKRREKQEQQEAERQARIAEETANMGPSDRMKEEEQLAKLLTPLGLGMRDIKADGHCLYRAIEDQLRQRQSSSSMASIPTYADLREKAADYIRSHPDDFVPFIYDEDKGGDPEAQLTSYCDEITSTAVWGGQLELGALAEALKAKIEVHAVGMPTVTLGEAYADGQTLRVCYMRHAFGLGEHYNSVETLSSSVAS